MMNETKIISPIRESSSLLSIEDSRERIIEQTQMECSGHHDMTEDKEQTKAVDYARKVCRSANFILFLQWNYLIVSYIT